MPTVTALLVTYVLGGLTFVPLCVAAFVGFLFYTSPVVLHPPRNSFRTASDTQAKTSVDDALDDQEPVTVYRAGWITARRTYEPTLNGTAHDGTYAGMLASGYRSFMDHRSKDPRRSKPKDRFFAVLKHNILFLYESEDMHECWAAIEVSSHDVVVYPEGFVDGEFWVKRTAIELKPKLVGSNRAEPGSDGHDRERDPADAPVDGINYDPETGKPLPWFLFAKVNSDKEDWYHSLVLASRIGSPTCAADTARDRSLFSPDDMSHLVDSIDSLPDSIPMRWFNALLGRVFLAVYRTAALESYITSRIVRKLKRVKIPSMLSEILVREVDVGSATPLFSKPMLKELNAEGEASMECQVSYVGAIRITIETVATVSISSRFKPYSVRLVLAVVLQELEGTLLLKIKKPPSNRIWFGFTSMPKIKMAVEPVVSTRQLKWSMVTSPIESRIREVIAESIVLPHMDDLSFFSTLDFPSTARGGIFGTALRQERPDLNVPATTANDTTPKTDHDLVSLAERGPDEEDLIEPGASRDRDPDAKDKVKAVEGVLISEGKDTVERARQRIVRRRSSASSSVTDETLDSFKTQLEPKSPTNPATVTKRPSSIKSTSSAASTSVSSLAGLASAKIASWREKKDAGSNEALAAAITTAGGGAGTKRTSSWFAAKPSPGLSTPGTTIRSDPSNTTTYPETLSRQNTRTTSTSSFLPLQEVDPSTSSTGPASSPSKQEEVSASRLREIMTQRAESREREKKEQEIALGSETDVELNKVLPPATTTVSEPSLVTPSNLSLTAPRSDTSKPLPSISLESVEPVSSTPESNVAADQVNDSSSRSDAPQLPHRPAWIKPNEAETDVPVLDASPSSLPPPPPPIRRSPSHSASASVDSSLTAAVPTTTASILSSWRAKAADKEAIAQSVAQAKESMRKWGAGWNARRTAGRPADAEGAGLVVPSDESLSSGKEGLGGVSDAGQEEEGYRDYHRKRASYYAPSESNEPSPPTSPKRPLPAPPALAHKKSTSTASPTRMRASSVASTTSSTFATATAHFEQSASSSPSIQLESAIRSNPASPPPTTRSTIIPSSSPSTSPLKPIPNMMSSGGGSGYPYGRATMMQLPGIRDESRKKLVSEDHLAGENHHKVEPARSNIQHQSTTTEPSISTTTSLTSEGFKPSTLAMESLPRINGDSNISSDPPRLPPRSNPLEPTDTTSTVPPPPPPALPPRSVPTVPVTEDLEPSRKATPDPSASRVDQLEQVADEAGWGLESS
ncbi:Nvj2p [Sporobolomyces koalae]|uniref:Nvj2p n=1 Tax=Sporobolomyces koalae TaxID=500713 RepID=UPI003181BC09